MKISSSSIVSQINANFSSAYAPHAWFVGYGPLWNECINTVNDVKLMNNIIFCNDIIGLPPTKVFLLANKSVTGPLSDKEKKALGAFWGFIFKYVIGYSNQKNDVPVNTKSVKKAAVFLDPVDIVEVV